MRVAWLAALAALLVVAAPAATAQSPVTVEGGGSFVDAPVLVPGVYADSIQLGETLYYAVDLAAGQRLTATTSIAGQPGGRRFSVVALRATLFSPNREPDLNGDAVTAFNGIDTTSVEVRGEVVGAGSGAFGRPGRYYVELRFAGETLPEPRDYQLQIALAVAQEGTASTTTSRPSTTTVTLAPTTAPPETAPAPDGGGDGRSLSLAIAAASFLAGAVAGGAVRWARWRRAATA